LINWGVSSFLQFSYCPSKNNKTIITLLYKLHPNILDIEGHSLYTYENGGKMQILAILKIIAAIGTFLTGLLVLIKPKAAEGFTGLTAGGPRGISEFRAVFGGLFVALGLFPLIIQSQVAYQMLGWGYLAIAFARLISVFIDKSYDRSNLISLGIEIVFGVILVI
jgi:hypothetical protein